jgi:hypothetical protein
MPDPVGLERPVFLAANGRRARAMRLVGGLVSLATLAWLAALVAGATAVNGVPRLALTPGGGGPPRAQFASLKTGGGARAVPASRARAAASRRRAATLVADFEPVAEPVPLGRRTASAPRGRPRRAVGRRTRAKRRALSPTPAARRCRAGTQSGASRSGSSPGRGLPTCTSGIV